MRGFLAVTTLWLVAIGIAPAWSQSEISGTAIYRERIALPPDAVFEATLEDVSRAGARSVVLGRHRIESPGQPPIRFKIDYDPAIIMPANRYAIRARITRNGQLMFTTDTFYPAFSGDEPTYPLELLLRMVPAKAGASAIHVESPYVLLAFAAAPRIGH